MAGETHKKIQLNKKEAERWCAASFYDKPVIIKS